MKALDLAGADLPLEGQLVVAAPGQIPAATAGRMHRRRDAARDVGHGARRRPDRRCTFPTYLVATTGALAALGPAYIQICLPPPDVPSGRPGGATFGAKVYSAELTINGVFSAVPLGAWISFWTPYTPGRRARRTSPARSHRPAAIAPGAVTLAAKTLGQGRDAHRPVTQAGQARGGATVTIFGGREGDRAQAARQARRSRRTASSRSRRRPGRSSAPTRSRRPAPRRRSARSSQPRSAPIPCVNPTVNGFTAKSKVVRKK